MFPKWFSRAVSLEDKPHQDFPPRDLIDHLADKYFEQINVYLPLLHRPTFDKALNEGRHTRNRAFGTIVLLICANGSRWSDDPRVQSEDEIFYQIVYFLSISGCINLLPENFSFFEIFDFQGIIVLAGIPKHEL